MMCKQTILKIFHLYNTMEFFNSVYIIRFKGRVERENI